MRRAVIQPTTSLPVIVEFLDRIDYGPCDDGEPSTHCPHCGSGGRYVNTFRCDDGSTRAAMDGCVQLFRVSPLADVGRKLAGREADLKKRFGESAHLNSWDTKTKEILAKFYAGEVDEKMALFLVRQQHQLKANYRRQKGYVR